MKFSIAATSSLILVIFATLVRGDAYADAIAEWCNGINVVAPTNQTVVVAGNIANVTVTRIPNEHEKTITGLDLYNVNGNGQAQYVRNVWAGNFTLNTQASLNDTVPANATAGLYYYRVWVTNQISGEHGPDCIELSQNFKVTTGVHTNSDGVSYYSESLDDVQFYHPEYFKGCFGLTVDSPQEGDVVELNDHVSIAISRGEGTPSVSVLKQVDLYKADTSSPDKAKYVDTVWDVTERFTSSFTLRDHFVLDSIHVDPKSIYYYAVTVSSNTNSEEDCTFHSSGFTIKGSV
ncbi:hypothetical protein BX666DRAFT_2033330 [Dichotomocladium elegans]|nr:hypothetical protein BX666DRAFT_2033330 [Dichotomocladium elegans]